ncbi:hypothetical protein SHIRM173S_07880 [Streptomyces hirsutus]
MSDYKQETWLLVIMDWFALISLFRSRPCVLPSPPPRLP